MTKVRLQISDLLNNRFDLNKDGLSEKYDELLPAWNKVEKEVLSGLTKITGLKFKRNYLDVMLINEDGKPSISFPLIVKMNSDVNKTIRTIIHELIHNLLWDNTADDNWSIKIAKLYPEENFKTAIHVAVHAILSAVYQEVLHDSISIGEDIEECKIYPDYKKAWQIVLVSSYRTIIDNLKA